MSDVSTQDIKQHFEQGDCPYCHDSSLEYRSFDTAEGNVYQRGSCTGCGREFTDIYHPAGIFPNYQPEAIYLEPQEPSGELADALDVLIENAEVDIEGLRGQDECGDALAAKLKAACAVVQAANLERQEPAGQGQELTRDTDDPESPDYTFHLDRSNTGGVWITVDGLAVYILDRGKTVHVELSQAGRAAEYDGPALVMDKPGR